MDDATLTAKLKADLTWLQKHEKMILVALAGVVLWFAIGKIDTLIANHDTAVLHQAEVTANIQADWNKKQAEIVAQQAAEYKALAEKVSQQNAALEQANVALATALTKQQKIDATLPPTELAQRWNTLVPTASAVVTPSGISVPILGAVATVQELEKVPVLSEQLTNTQTQFENEKKLVNQSTVEKQSLYAQVDGLKLQIVDDSKVCKAEVAVVKAEARKGKRKWFLIGFAAGFVARQVIKFGL
jgi:hypothetical protein